MRDRDTGVDSYPEWYGHRFGRLVSVGLVTSRRGVVCAVLMRCECSRLVRVGISRLHHRTVPFECPKCQKENPKHKRRYATSLRKSYPREWRAWNNLHRGRNRPQCWRKFRPFMRYMGPCPKDHHLARRIRTDPHGPGNSYWERDLQWVVPLILGTEPITPAYLSRHYGVKKAFCRSLQRQGTTDATEIIRAWRARPGGKPPQPVHHRRLMPVPPRETSSARWTRELAAE